MATDNALDRAFDSVADGAPVDWASVEAETANDDARAQLRQLQIVARLAGAHRTLSLQAHDAATHTTGPSHPRADAGGTPWGRYLLLERIGAGTFGTVYRAWDPELERNIAIKLLHPLGDLAGNVRDRLLREGRAIAKVRHQNVVSVFGVEVNDGRVGLCMELVDGRTLDEVVRDQGPLSAREAAIIGQVVCSALSAVHAAGLVHRDVKARNVMREVGGRIVLMDFGTGHAIGDGTQHGGGAVAGTPLYMAPEALHGAGTSIAADIYSTGVLLFYLVTGRYPLEGATLAEVEQAHARGERRYVSDFRPDLPAAFVRTVEQALDPRPERRHRNPARLMVDLLSQVEHVTPEPGPSPWAQAIALIPTDAVRMGSALTMAIGACLALGFLNSWAYAYLFGLDPRFVDESPLTWIRWGLKSIIAPGVLMIGLTIAGAVALEVSRLVRRVSSSTNRALLRVAAGGNRLLRVAGWPVSTAFGYALIASGLAFAAWVAFGAFGDLLASCLTPVDRASADTLLRLSPANEVEHTTYRQVVTVGVLALLVGWRAVWRVATRRGERIPRGVLVAGALSTALSIVLLDIPYRILWQNEAERVVFGGARCYALASQAGAVRLFCPDSTPRLRVASADDPRLSRTGTVENVFANDTPAARE